MAKRRLLLNENQLDIGGSSIRFSQIDADYTKQINGLVFNGADVFGETTASMINAGLLTGSRNFVASTEASAESVYIVRGRAKVITGGGSPAPTFSIRASFFGHDLRTVFNFTAGSSTTYRFLVDFSLEISFKNVAGQDKLGVTLTWKVVDEFTVTKNYWYMGGDSTNLGLNISGSSDLDLLVGGTQSTSVRVMNIECKQIK